MLILAGGDAAADARAAGRAALVAPRALPPSMRLRPAPACPWLALHRVLAAPPSPVLTAGVRLGRAIREVTGGSNEGAAPGLRPAVLLNGSCLSLGLAGSFR
ncbi:MAG TPA: hypothetical protein VGQ83_27510 [Polyangia bacterium]